MPLEEQVEANLQEGEKSDGSSRSLDSHTVFEQGGSRGPVCNGTVEGGINTTYDSGGKSSCSGSHNLISADHISSVHFTVSMSSDMTDKADLLPQVLKNFQDPQNRDCLVHSSPEVARDIVPPAVNCTIIRPLPTAVSTQAETDDEDSNVSSMSDIDLRSPPSQVITNGEIYTRRLLCCGEGLPCWRPRPHKSLGQQGAVPGDVGTFDLRHGFKKIFNLWQDKDSSMRWSLPSEDVDVTDEHFPMGHKIVSGVSWVAPLTEKKPFECFEFKCDSKQGAVLACPTVADLVELDSTRPLHDFLIKNAGILYQRANALRPLGKEESLYVVTGCIKSDAWGLAAYQGGRAGEALRLSKIDDGSSNEIPNYRWTEGGKAEARFGRNSAMDAGSYKGKNQSLFLTGFKVAFSSKFRDRVDGSSWREDGSSGSGRPGPSSGSPDDDRQGSDGGGNFGGDGSSSGQTDPSSRSPDDASQGSDGQSSGSSGATLKEAPVSNPGGSSLSTVPENTQPCDRLHVEYFPDDPNTHFHPSDTITKLLLEMTGADCALSHDDDWRYIIKGPLWNDTSILNIITSRTITVTNGVASLLPTTDLPLQIVLTLSADVEDRVDRESPANNDASTVGQLSSDSGTPYPMSDQGGDSSPGVPPLSGSSAQDVLSSLPLPSPISGSSARLSIPLPPQPTSLSSFDFDSSSLARLFSDSENDNLEGPSFEHISFTRWPSPTLPDSTSSSHGSQKSLGTRSRSNSTGNPHLDSHSSAASSSSYGSRKRQRTRSRTNSTGSH